MSADFLRQVPLFADLDPADLDRLCQMVEVVDLGRGETLFEEGSPGDRAYVIRTGELEVLKRTGGREVLLAVRRSGEVIGEMSLLEESPRMATVKARKRARLLAIDQAQLAQLVNTSASAARSMFYTVLGRWRATSATVQQSERMAQLGTLTAGVAHELNNPAAAVKRGSDQLLKALADLEKAMADLRRASLDATQEAALERLTADARVARPVELDTLARADREAELEDWLDDHGADMNLAADLVDLGLDPAALDTALSAFSAEQLPAVIRSLGATRGTYDVLEEIKQGAGRISSIIGALKQYSFLDQAPIQEVDVHEGLDNTLLILRSKLKKGINVKRDYDPQLPRITAHGSALNQVWTNLIDNACDALDAQAERGEAEITVRTRRHGREVMVEIEDNGPGIPPEIQGRVFDAFFTTKAPGKGTGQGLAIAWRIVTVDHGGVMRLTSEPGRTCFQVVLPIDPDAVVGEPEADEAGAAEAWLLENSKTIAMVGITTHPERAAYTVPQYLQGHGYKIFPVHPRASEILGEPVVKSLAELQPPIDLVVAFRQTDDLPDLVDEAVRLGAKGFWMQPGVIHEAAAEKARRAGLRVVVDSCARQAHVRVHG